VQRQIASTLRLVEKIRRVLGTPICSNVQCRRYNCNGHGNCQRLLDFISRAFIGGRSFQLSEAISECLLESIAGMLFFNPLFKLPCEQRNKGEQFWNRRKDI
jgi:hypothetical protein